MKPEPPKTVTSLERSDMTQTPGTVPTNGPDHSDFPAAANGLAPSGRLGSGHGSRIVQPRQPAAAGLRLFSAQPAGLAEAAPAAPQDPDRQCPARLDRDRLGRLPDPGPAPRRLKPQIRRSWPVALSGRLTASSRATAPWSLTSGRDRRCQAATRRALPGRWHE